MAKLPDMSADFARWYTEAFMDDGSRRDLRWKGLLAATAKADHEVVEVLTRLAFQTPVAARGRKSEELNEVYDRLIVDLAGGDTTFDPTNSARELQILAAAALVRLFETNCDAALTVVTASFVGARRPDLPMDLLCLAEKALIALASSKHTRIDVGELKIAAPKINYELEENELEGLDHTKVEEQFKILQASNEAAIQRVVLSQNKIIQRLYDQILLDEEELQILWWLFGGYSQLLNKPFSKATDLEKPLALAHELGNMTVVAPGPSSIRAMLLRVGVTTKKVKFSDAVNAANLEWAQSASESKLVSPVTTPIHFALEQRADLGSDDSWQAGWSSLTGLASDTSISAIELSELFYREHVFINVSA
ncbi:GTPase-associated system all-helical protein GASH [Labrenzia sp. PHM005]|uniref:GTPase-associated system all-helical protein GASH n=1 Tax=Labrenzia sp. PHM005 TaxID=2590016 RepID=UPI0011404EE8|nr:GTPase-associated system all-helical protein GASH [Labrenzia sp. PHM005]QDG74809.1 hypothetical protein FJ695_02405 [Labrenzia sp. PHM005]